MLEVDPKSRDRPDGEGTPQTDPVPSGTTGSRFLPKKFCPIPPPPDPGERTSSLPTASRSWTLSKSETPHRTIFQTLGIASFCRRSMLRLKPENDQIQYPIRTDTLTKIFISLDISLNYKSLTREKQGKDGSQFLDISHIDNKREQTKQLPVVDL